MSAINTRLRSSLSRRNAAETCARDRAEHERRPNEAETSRGLMVKSHFSNGSAIPSETTKKTGLPLSVLPISRDFQLSDLLPRSLNKALDKFGGGLVDAFDDELRVVEMGQGLFEVAQAGGDLRMHGVEFL